MGSWKNRQTGKILERGFDLDRSLVFWTVFPMAVLVVL